MTKKITQCIKDIKIFNCTNWCIIIFNTIVISHTIYAFTIYAYRFNIINDANIYMHKGINFTSILYPVTLKIFFNNPQLIIIFQHILFAFSFICLFYLLVITLFQNNISKIILLVVMCGFQLFFMKMEIFSKILTSGLSTIYFVLIILIIYKHCITRNIKYFFILLGICMLFSLHKPVYIIYGIGILFYHMIMLALLFKYKFRLRY